jgi:hypothetical protein
MVSVEEAVKHINYMATKKNWCKTRYNIARDEVIYEGKKYYKTLSYLSDRSEVYTYIENYLKHNNIPHSIEIVYNNYYISKEGKQVYDKKLLFTIKIT